MRYVMMALALGACGPTPSQTTPSPAPPSSMPPVSKTPAPAGDRSAVVRVLDRFAFGPARGQVEQVLAKGLDAWFERQLTLKPESVPDEYRKVTLPPLELVASMTAASMVESGADESVSTRGESAQPKARNAQKKVKINFRRVSEMLTMAQLTRHVQSEHQLAEVMVDFWVNHFNIFARKGDVKLYAGHYVETAIRPHVLGQFEDLVIATAQHPAMLLYLDNAKSRAPLTGKALKRAQRRAAARASQNKKPRRRRDLNENYARELLELHTVGANHSQADVVAAARVLTGWGVKPVQQGGGFVFKRKLHDSGQKKVLGRSFGPGQQAGVEMLRFLARHPQTGRHLGEKLCQRFVSDAPSPVCIDAVAQAHQQTQGQIPAMLRAVYALVRTNTGVTTKLKTPVEFLASALRIVDGKPESLLLAKTLKKLGQPTLMMPVPTGYSEVAHEWNGSTSMLRRLNVAAALGRGKLKGVALSLDHILPKTTPDLVARINRDVLHGRASESTLATMRAQLQGVRQPKQARRIALTLALGSPEFLSQ